LYSLTEAQQFSTAIFEASDDDHIGWSMKHTSDVKIVLKFKSEF
jgi:hypothetical protein